MLGLVVLVSNTSCLLHLSNAPGRSDLKHWILEASNCGFMPAKGHPHAIGMGGRPSARWAGSPKRRFGVGRAAGRWKRREGREGVIAGEENYGDGLGATDRSTARCRLTGSTTRPADFSKRPIAEIATAGQSAIKRSFRWRSTWGAAASKRNLL